MVVHLVWYCWRVNVLTITANSAFDGYVAYVSCYELASTYSAALLDADTETAAAVSAFNHIGLR